MYFDIFLIGMLTTELLRHGYAHFRPHKLVQPKVVHAPNGNHLPPEVKERMLQASEAQFQTVLTRSADELQHDLQVTAEQVNKQVTRLATEIVGGELERYKTEFSRLHEQTQADLGGVSKELEAHQAEMKAQLAADIEAEKQQLIKLMDTKLADAVTSFLLETLQHNVDLGSQSTYLLSMLDEHKAELTKGVTGEA